MASPASERPAPRSSILTGALLTVAAWLLTRLAVGIVLPSSRNPFRLEVAQWFHWDSRNYLVIAEQGRNFGRCGSAGFPAAFATKPPGWCGTAGWLPGYPWAMRLVHLTGLSLPRAGILVSWVALAAALFLVWWGWGRELSAGRALLVLLLFGLFPGSVYNFAEFPTSPALALVVGALVAATSDRFLVAAVLMAAAGLCYPSAWFAAAGLAVGLVVLALPLGPGAVARRAGWGLMGLAGLAALLLHDQVAFHRANAYMLVQEHPGFTPTPFPGQAMLKGSGRTALTAQAITGIALALGAAVVAAVQWVQRRRQAAVLYPALVGVAVVVGITFIAGDHAGAWNRSVVLAAPSVVCFRRCPIIVLVAAVAAVGVITAIVSQYFFNNTLV